MTQPVYSKEIDCADGSIFSTDVSPTEYIRLNCDSSFAKSTIARTRCQRVNPRRAPKSSEFIALVVRMQRLREIEVNAAAWEA
jgi:hypothetical protein